MIRNILACDLWYSGIMGRYTYLTTSKEDIYHITHNCNLSHQMHNPIQLNFTHSFIDLEPPPLNNEHLLSKSKFPFQNPNPHPNFNRRLPPNHHCHHPHNPSPCPQTQQNNLPPPPVTMTSLYASRLIPEVHPRCLDHVMSID